MAPITAPQLNYATDLATKIYATNPTMLLAEIADLATLTSAQARLRITRLVDTLKAKHAAELASKPVKVVPAGWYLVDGVEYQVKIAKKSKAPYLISKDGEYLGALKGDAPKILSAIEADPIGLAKEYGKATGTCGICSKTLTNPDSIALGIGPVCAGKF
jgi:uncharacterized protein DUF6011